MLFRQAPHRTERRILLNVEESRCSQVNTIHTALLDRRVTDCQVHMENLPQASKWFNILLARVPSDPGILSRMGHIANKEDDDSQAYFYHKER